jgi:hypothetical protein
MASLDGLGRYTVGLGFWIKRNAQNNEKSQSKKDQRLARQ